MIWPILLLLGLGAGAYALSQREDGGGAGKKRRAGKGPPPPLSQQIPGGTNPKVEAFKSKVEDLKRKAAQGDKDAGKTLADLKTAWGNLNK